MINTNINPTLVWYYYICHREVWFMSRHIVPEQDETNIALGRLISEESYKREKKEIRFENMVVDLIKKENNEVVICEVKKSSKYLQSAKMQLSYYLYELKQKGLLLKGELLFPKEKTKVSIELSEDIEKELQETIKNINNIINEEIPPKLIKINYCKKCGYKELCFS